jgi:hypothetical protein
MALAEVKISVTEIEPFKQLLTALKDNYGGLPDEVKESLDQLFKDTSAPGYTE